MKNKILAALIFFTRLPFWRIKEVPAEDFKTVVNYWPLVGWLTGGITAIVLWGCNSLFTMPIAVILAFGSRILLTGALHEDGLSDFFDGFGGGKNREQILAIMKDSRIGSYGVIGLIFYFGCLFAIFMSLPPVLACCAVIAADPATKSIVSQLLNLLPYARKEEDSKAKIIYKKMHLSQILLTMIGLLPMFLFLDSIYWLALIAPVLIFSTLVILMKNKLQGYTGDCYGAAFLLSELSFYAALLIIFQQINYL